MSKTELEVRIKQFDIKFKASKEKWKTQGQWILNIIYPDKSSNEYMEYLQNCTDYKNGYLTWPGNDFEVNNLFEYLILSIGTEIKIRTRQRLFRIKDSIESMIDPVIPCVSSGSLAEGIDLQGSDLDLMQIIKTIDVIQDESDITYPLQRTTLVMEEDNDYPGFVRLKLVAQVGEKSPYLTSDLSDGSYVSTKSFIDNIRQFGQHLQLDEHGPCVSNKMQTVDLVFCFQSNGFPTFESRSCRWSSLPKNKWPYRNLINNGCLIVPKGPKNLLWRKSFSLLEKKLVHSFNYTQLLCYNLLKLTLQRIISTHPNVKDLLCSYFLKTAMFWVSEKVDIETFKLSKLFYCFSLCFEKLISWVERCYCPNYFIPENNMFLGKICDSNNKDLLKILKSMKFNGIETLVNYALPSNQTLFDSLRKMKEESFISIDFLFYRLNKIPCVRNISHCDKLLEFIESLGKSDSCMFIKGVCSFYYAQISQYATQLLPPLPPLTELRQPPCTLNKLYHQHLNNGTETDAVSGWLLYASFYYVTGQYDESLKTIDHVLSKYKTDLIYLGRHVYDENHVEQYRKNVDSEMTLNERMAVAIEADVRYLKHSPLVPRELQDFVENRDLCMYSIVMCYFLKAFCYTHLGDECKLKQALEDLCTKGKEYDDMYNNEISDANPNQNHICNLPIFGLHGMMCPKENKAQK